MEGALGGLIDAYGDSDEEAEAPEGAEADPGNATTAGRVVLAPTLQTLSSAPPTSPAQPSTTQLGLTPPLAPLESSDPGPDGLGSGDILTAMQQQQRLGQPGAGASPPPMGLSGTAASGVPLSPGLVPDAGASPVQGVVGDGAGRQNSSEPEPDLSLPAELPPLTDKPCRPELQVLISNLLNTQKHRGQTLNSAMKSHRDYRNPNFLQKMVEFCDIKQYESQYPKELWDPAGLKAEDYSDALLQEHERYQIRKQAERQKRGTVEFTPAAGAAARAVAAVGSRQVDPRALTQAAARTSAMLTGQAASKRSKWDNGR